MPNEGSRWVDYLRLTEQRKERNTLVSTSGEQVAERIEAIRRWFVGRR